MSFQMIADAVVNGREDAEITWWDRLFALWFKRLVYNQIWEDPEADLAALNLPAGATMLTISSGGCNALSYLTADPARIYAVDLNDAHLAMLKIKLAGLRGIDDYAGFYGFFGGNGRPENDEIYRRQLRPRLDSDARAFWDGRDLTLRRRHRYFATGIFRHGALGQFIGLAHQVARLCRADLSALLRPEGDPARVRTLARVERFFASKTFRALTNSPALLFSLGIPPRQRVLLAGPDGRLDRVLRERFLKVATGFPPEDNYFAWQALTRSYPGPGDRCLPPYLQARHFQTLRDRAERVMPVHANLRELLQRVPEGSIDAFVLLDSQDWMADEEIMRLWQAIDRAGSPSAQVIFRTAGADSPLDGQGFAPIRDAWQRDAEASATGFTLDRSGIYGGFHLYRRRG